MRTASCLSGGFIALSVILSAGAAYVVPSLNHRDGNKDVLRRRDALTRRNAAAKKQEEDDATGRTGQTSRRNVLAAGGFAAASVLSSPDISGAAQLPLPSLSSPTDNGSPPSFFTTLRKYYPNALPASVAADKVTAELTKRGYTPVNTLMGSSLCYGGSGTDDSGSSGKNQLYSQLQAAFDNDASGRGGRGGAGDAAGYTPPPASVTNLGGVAGIPFVGPAGFDTFFSYVPGGGGKVVIVFAPSVGIDEGGTTAGTTTSQSPAIPCGSVVDAFTTLRAEGSADSSPAANEFGIDALQKQYYIKELRQRLSTNNVDVASVDANDPAALNSVLSKITYSTYDIISDLLLTEIDALVQSKKATFDVSEVTILGGITVTQVGGRGSFGEYFLPIVFQSMSKVAGRSFVEKDNLLESLLEKPKASQMERSRPAADGNASGGLPMDAKIQFSDESLRQAGIAFAGAAAASGSIASIGASIQNKQQETMSSTSPTSTPPQVSGTVSPSRSGKARSATMLVTSKRKEGSPEGIPKITQWRQNVNDGSISGNVSGSTAYPDGSYITTSPITGDPSDVRTGQIVRTASGSQYYLGKRPEPSMTWIFSRDNGPMQQTEEGKSGARARTYSIPTSTNKESIRATISLPTQSTPTMAQTEGEGGSLFSRLFRGNGKIRTPAPRIDPAVASLLASLEEEIDGTDRGLFSFSSRKGKIASLIRELEGLCPIDSPAVSRLNVGTWELIYSDTNFFLTSPFFLARQDLCSSARGERAFARYITNLQSSSSLGTIGTVRQIVTESELISEIDIISDSIDGAVVSTASIRPTLSGRAWDVSLSSLEVRGSNTFVVRQLIDIKNGSNLPGGELLFGSRALLETTYLDGNTRISRDAVGRVLVFRKTSDGTSPSDYKYLDGAASGIRII